MSEKIAVIGTGYVGLVSGTCFAEIGNAVVCMDRDPEKVERLRQGSIPIYEPDLAELVVRNMSAGRLRFTDSMAEAVREADIVFIAVGTPSLPNGDVDMRQIDSALDELAEHVDKDKIVVMKSTVPVGTGDRAERLLRSKVASELRVDVVSSPEFLREGSAVYDTFHMDRIVIGAESAEAAERIRALHEPFQAPVVVTDRASAEMIKYASNAFLAMKISFINEIANVCEKVGADVTSVARGMGMDKRIGMPFLNAGIGYGGTCFPKDTKAQIRIAEHVDYDFKILRSVVTVNHLQRVKFVHKIEQALDGRLQGARIAVMGLTFKPNTDDMRDAPSLDIVAILQAKGAVVTAFDPVVGGQAERWFREVQGYTEPYAALAGADVLAIVTEWNEVKTLDMKRVKDLMARPVVVDGRNVFEPQALEKLGFEYYSVGRPAVR